MDHERIRRVLAAMEEASLDALVCRLAENVLFLSTYWPRSGNSFAILRRDGHLTLLVPDGEMDIAQTAKPHEVTSFGYGEWQRDAEEEMRQSLFKALRGTHRVGVEQNFESVAPAFTAGEVLVPALATFSMVEAAIGRPPIDATALLNRLRAVKTPFEAEMIARAARAVQPGLSTFVDRVGPGTTEVELVAAVEGAVTTGAVRFGGTHARAWAMVIGGPRTSGCYRPFYPTGNRALVEGDPVLIELGACVDGYWTDVTRVAWVGGMDDSAARLYRLVRDAQRRAIDSLRPGMHAREVDRVARQVFEKAGLGDRFLHHTGHGIGLRYHEPIPFLHPNSPHVLEAGMIMSVEPGIYGRDFGGIRLEDIVMVTDDGPKVLTSGDT